VGRERELSELEAGLEDALSGRGRLFVIGGEPGIGKTRLADELASRAKQRGARVLSGRCWEAGGAPAYWPWVQAIRTHLRDQDPQALLLQLGSGAADVAQMVPELHDLFPELRPPPSLDPEGARFRLFDSTTAFLRSASRTQPIVLVLDDLHAADVPSLLLLQFVARELVDAHILLIGAYRDEGTKLPPQLASTLAEVGRQQVTRHVRLAGLDESEMTGLIEGILDGSASETLVAAVHRKTEGNPLFVVEVVRLLAEEGQLETREEPVPLRITIPPRVKEVIGRRLELLSERCYWVLALASVLGREFRIDALARVSDLSAEALLELIDEAAAARVVTEVPSGIGRLRFSHALVRDALYEGLATAQRTRLHREIGEALEGVHVEDPEAHLAELAHHFCEAAPGGDVDKAVEYARRAGERAATLLAYEEAVRLFRLALHVLEMRGPADREARCRLLLALGESQAREGDLGGAKETFLQAADLARKGNMPEHLAAAALGYGGRFVWSRAGSDRKVVPLLEEALRSLPKGDSTIGARLMARLAGAIRDERPPNHQDRLSREAVEMARRMGDPATLAYALAGRLAATWWPENAEERLTIATEILRLGRQADDGERIAQGLGWRVVTLLELGDIAAFDVELEALTMLVEELRQPAQRWLLLHWRATRALVDGRFEEAERLIPEALSLGKRAQRSDAISCFRIQMYFLRREQGRLEEVEAIIKRSVAEYPTRPLFRSLLAHLYSELGHLVESRRAFEELAVRDFADLRRDNEWLLEMSLLAEVADFLGDVGGATILYGLLSPFAGRNVSVAGDASAGSASRGLGVLASMLLTWDEAVRHFEEALDLNAAMGARPWVARTQHDYARMLLRRDRVGDRERAAELLTRALETCRELGMPALNRKVTALLKAEGIPPVDGARVAASLEPQRAYIFRREGEYWSIRFDRDTFRLKDSKGLGYLAQLLGSPARQFLAFELMTAGVGSGPEQPAPRGRGERRERELRPSSGRTGEILDHKAKEAYRRRIEELQDELEEAEGWGDFERAARARGEMDFLARELAAAVGLGGRGRRASSDAERARVNVTKAIKASMARIGKHSPALAHHLASTIRTGTFCSYLPDPRLPAVWQL
jgi:tetratricopeptide (TPR) repeat protein